MFLQLSLLLLIFGQQAQGFSRVSGGRRRVSLLSASSTFEAEAAASVAGQQHAPSPAALPYLEQRRPLKVGLLACAARTSRGEIGSAEDKQVAVDLVSQLESLNPVASPASSDLVLGRWELVWSSTYLFRSSPLFIAARAVCKEGPEAERFNLFCRLHREALAWTQIGKVVQEVSATKLTSEFEASGSPLLGLPGPFVIKGVIQSSADIESRGDNDWVLYMDKIRIKPSSSNVPVLSNVLDEFDGIATRSISSILEQRLNVPTPRPRFFVTYVDTHMRISRDQEDNIFVYNRV